MPLHIAPTEDGFLTDQTTSLIAKEITRIQFGLGGSVYTVDIGRCSALGYCVMPDKAERENLVHLG